MQNTTNYNGWTNYETWLVKLWMDNEEGSCNYWIEEAQRVFDAAEESDTFTKAEQAALDLEDILKDQHEESLPEMQGFVADLVNAAMSEVNWHQIAVSLIEDNCEIETNV